MFLPSATSLIQVCSLALMTICKRPEPRLVAWITALGPTAGPDWEPDWGPGVFDTGTTSSGWLCFCPWAAVADAANSPALRRVAKYETDPISNSAATASHRFEVRASSNTTGARNTAGGSCTGETAGGEGKIEARIGGAGRGSGSSIGISRRSVTLISSAEIPRYSAYCRTKLR